MKSGSTQGPRKIDSSDKAYIVKEEEKKVVGAEVESEPVGGANWRNNVGGGGKATDHLKP